MSRKRQNTSSADEESPPPRRQRLASSSQSSDADDGDVANSYEQPRINLKTGLAGAFPGLTDDSDGGLFYGPADDGLDYLRMVRSEAKIIPSLLSIAPTTYQTNTHDAAGNRRCDGFFDGDQAVIAAPLQPQKQDTHLSKAQQAYYDSIFARFLTLRRKLRRSPPLLAVQTLPEATPISFPPASKIARDNWQTFIEQNPANSVQVACMDSDSVFELIRLMTKKMRKLLGTVEVNNLQNIGTWFWASLAKCPDRGELGSEEISDLRACAKMAHDVWKWLQHRRNGLSGMETDKHLEKNDDNPDSTDDEPDSTDDEVLRDRGDNEGGLNVAADDLQVQRLSTVEVTIIPSQYPSLEQRVIIDMIVTVVGETYGQRDLLELRRPWGSPQEE